MSNLIFDLYGLPIQKESKELEALNSIFKDLHELAKWQEKHKWKIFNFHKLHNPLYKKKLTAIKVNKWEDVPIMHKRDYQFPIEEMLSEGMKKSDVHIGNTSGSSGHPFYYAKDKSCHARTYALINKRYNEHGISIGMKQARFYGIPLGGKQRYIEKIKDLLLNRVRFPVHDLSESTLHQFLAKFKRINFDFIYGYTSSIVEFSNFLNEQGVVLATICPSMKACIVTSEMCTDEDRVLMESALGVKVINEYGASEMDIIAITDTHNKWKLSNENIFVEIIDTHGNPQEIGQEGKLVVTSLFNTAMPFIRYEIGDFGKLNYDDSSILETLTGRTNDIIKLPSGKKAGGLTFYYISRGLLESGGIIREFIVKQISINTFLFEIVSDRQLNKNEVQQIEKMLEDYLEKGLNLEIRYVDKIKRLPNGKIKHFFSEI